LVPAKELRLKIEAVEMRTAAQASGATGIAAMFLYRDFVDGRSVISYGLISLICSGRLPPFGHSLYNRERRCRDADT